MKTVFKILIGVIVTSLVAIGGLFAYGATLPEQVRETRMVQLDGAKERVWALISDDRDLAAWWPQGFGLVTVETIPETKLVRKFGGDDESRAGTWLFVLTPLSKERTQLVLTEESRVSSPFRRAWLKLFIGRDAAAKSFIRALEVALKTRR